MTARPVVVPPGEGHRVGNVEFLARTADTPRFTFGMIEIAPGRELEAHVHVRAGAARCRARLRNDGTGPVRMLNIHAPAGFDRRIGLRD